MAYCRKCGERIDFVKTPKGKWLPVNPERRRGWEFPKEGRVTLVTPEGRIINDPSPTEEGYIAHWATCPNAEDFRK